MIILQNRISGREEEAEIVSPIAQQDIDCYVSDWWPVLSAKIDELTRTGQNTMEQRRTFNVEDTHWQWPKKAADRAKVLQWNSCAVRCGSKTQGLMFIDLIQRCRHPSQANDGLVYVDLLATAPWNRPRLVADPLYRGVGLVLITEAILLSQDEGFKGRIGLHALPGSEDWYRDNLKMVPLGPDPRYYGLLYFEMTEDHALEFLSS